MSDTTGRTKPSRARQQSESAGLRIVFVLPSGAAQLVPLPEKGELFIGRDAAREVCLDDASVSRKHARIVGGRTPEIEDAGSTNGTRVAGRWLTPGMRASLTLGTLLELGDVTGVVRPATEDTSPRPPFNPAPRRVATHGVPASTGDAYVKNPEMIELYALADVIAPSQLPVLILGETGVGKDVYARHVHTRSQRAQGPFLRINCAALPENLLEAELFGYEKGAFTGAVQAKQGLFESANGGTVFLDELGEMPLGTQAKLLTVLENGEAMRIGSLRPHRIDVRFVAATHRDLEARVASGDFRQDLYYRVTGITVMLPPLRRRPEEILGLATLFAPRAAGSMPVFTDEAAAMLLRHRWPGNIRELRNVMQRAELMSAGKSIEAKHIQLQPNVTGRTNDTRFPPPLATPEGGVMAAGGSVKSELSEIERSRITEALALHNGNQTKAAQALGISRATLVRRLEAYGTERPRKKS